MIPGLGRGGLDPRRMKKMMKQLRDMKGMKGLKGLGLPFSRK